MANKIIDRKQYTVSCHIDDMKFSHIDKSEWQLYQIDKEEIQTDWQS